MKSLTYIAGPLLAAMAMSLASAQSTAADRESYVLVRATDGDTIVRGTAPGVSSEASLAVAALTSEDTALLWQVVRELVLTGRLPLAQQQTILRRTWRADTSVWQSDGLLSDALEPQDAASKLNTAAAR